MPGRKAKIESIEVPALDIRRMSFWVTGTTPFVSHAWSEKARKMLADGQSGAPKQGKKQKEGRRPYEEFVDALYFSDEDVDWSWTAPDGEVFTRRGRPGMPARMFKAAAVEAATDVGVFKTSMRSAFFVEGDILPIVGSEPVFRVDPVRLESGVASLVYRPFFEEWSVALTIRYNAGVISAAHILNLFRTAGFGVGVGEGRPKSKKSCGMGWGTFDVGGEVETETRDHPAAELGMKTVARRTSAKKSIAA